MGTRFIKMTWHPLKDNPLDYVNNPYLFSNDMNKPVTLTREGALDDYVIRIAGNEVMRSGSLNDACRMLYAYDVGLDMPVVR